MPLTRLERILQQANEVLYRMIVSRQRRCEVDSSTCFSDPGVKLVILIPDQLFVVHPDAIKNFPSKRPERNGVNKSLLTARSKLRIANTKRTTPDGRDKPSTETFVCRHGHARPAYVIRARLC